MEGNHVRWADSWEFRVGFNAREGLVLHDLRFLEHTQRTARANATNTQHNEHATHELATRNVIFRASMCEMTVPYGDPRPQHYRKNAFDAGEYLFLFISILICFCLLLLFV